jgi:hypothetical protein
MPDNTSEIIEIAKIESKMFDNGGSQYKITTTGNKKFKFNDKLKAGGETVAYKQFKDMGIKVGSTVEVWYKSIEKDYQGTPYTDNMIVSFKEAGARPVASVAQKSAPQQEIKYEANKDTDWDEIAVGKCQSLFIAAYLQSGKTFADTKLQVVQARQLAELVVYGSQEKTPDQTTPEAEYARTAPTSEEQSLADSVPF